MEQVRTSETPVESVRNAIDLFLFSCHFHVSVNAGLVTPESFIFPFEIRTEVATHTINKKSYMPVQLRAYANNLLLAAESVLAIVVDDALLTFGPRNPDDTSDLGSARNISYMIRCAFAHNAFKPRWQCSPKYQRRYAIRAANVQFDGKMCNGKGLKPEDYGGLEGHMRLLDFCLQALKDLKS